MLKFFFHNCPRIKEVAVTLTQTSPLNGCWADDFDPVEFCGLSDFLFTVSSFSMLGGLIGTLLRSIESIGSFLELRSKDFSDLAESLFFTARRGLAQGRFRLRTDPLVG